MDDLLWPTIAFGSLAILYILYKYVTRYNNVFAKRGVPFVKPKFFFGSARELFFDKIQLSDFLQNLYDAMPSTRIFGFFHMAHPVFFVRDPEVFKQIAIKDFDAFEDHKFIIEPQMDTLFGRTLFLMRGRTWREMRATLSPTFTGSKMRHMFTLIRECAIQTRDNLLEDPNRVEHEIDVGHFFSRYGTDVIVSCAYGLKVNSFKDKTNLFLETGASFANCASWSSFLKIQMLHWLPRLMKILNIEFFDKHTRRVFTNLIVDSIKARKEQNISRPDLIDLLMNAKRKIISDDDKNNWKETLWSNEDLASQAFVFFFGGHDTMKWVLSALAYELARNPNIQDRLINEIDDTNSALDGADVTYEALNKMKYLDMVWSELLRLHAPFALNERLCTKDFTFKDGKTDVKFVKGDHLWFPTLSYHRDPNYWTDPQKFDPERFSEENKMNINTAYYIPFGSGPRQCIANRFSLLEGKVAFYYLLKDFEFCVSAKTEIPMKIRATHFVQVPANPLYLTLKKRQKL